MSANREYHNVSASTLIKRLRLYASYIGCGCSDSTTEQRARNQCNDRQGCARADYVMVMRALRRRPPALPKERKATP